MESFPRLRPIVPAVCETPCPTPAHKGELLKDLLPVVCTSVVLSTTYPQFTGRELESKIRNGEIQRWTNPFHENKHPVQADKHRDNRKKSEIVKFGTVTDLRKHRVLGNTTPGFFTDLAHLQMQLISGYPRGKPLFKDNTSLVSSMRSSQIEKRKKPTRRMAVKTRYQLLPPILDVWTQNDAMERSIRLGI
ncbi:Hypothetical predicted protein [Pelobates cultripes]|uniref:Uncharacterized protein n=1 Tax=Pelobates cultripes TaxID=61616 RepID=A0AAD1W8J4_PELCU|nr:Hypothetical predicted protein [Pelobates cultripes]